MTERISRPSGSSPSSRTAWCANFSARVRAILAVVLLSIGIASGYAVDGHFYTQGLTVCSATSGVACFLDGFDHRGRDLHLSLIEIDRCVDEDAIRLVFALSLDAHV